MEPETRNFIIFFLIKHGPWRNSSLLILLHGLSLWSASVRGDMPGLQMINYGTTFLSAAPLDLSSTVIALMLYSFFSGKSSRSLLGLLEFPSMERHPGPHCPLPCSLRVSSRLVHSLSTSFTSDHLLRETKGSVETLMFPNTPKRSHDQRGWMWSRVKKLLLGVWKSHLSSLHFPAPESYSEWHFVAGLNVKWSFCGISYQLRKIGWFWVQFFPSCGGYLRQVTWNRCQKWLWIPHIPSPCIWLGPW